MRKVVRRGNFVFTYVIENDDDPTTPSTFRVYKKEGDGSWIAGAGFETTRPGTDGGLGCSATLTFTEPPPTLTTPRDEPCRLFARFHPLSGSLSMPTVSLTVNGQAVEGEVEGRTLLVDFIRETLGLTGTHVGCDTSQCGACVVHVGGASVKSCTMLAVEADGADVTTVEGLATNGTLHPMQTAFHEHHGLQCGFCTPGMMLSGIDLVGRNANPSEHEVREWLEGNLCRCTGYHNIVKAVQAAAAEMGG